MIAMVAGSLGLGCSIINEGSGKRMPERSLNRNGVKSLVVRATFSKRDLFDELFSSISIDERT